MESQSVSDRTVFGIFSKQKYEHANSRWQVADSQTKSIKLRHNCSGCNHDISSISMDVMYSSNRRRQNVDVDVVIPVKTRSQTEPHYHCKNKPAITAPMKSKLEPSIAPGLGLCQPCPSSSGAGWRGCWAEHHPERW